MLPPILLVALLFLIWVNQKTEPVRITSVNIKTNQSFTPSVFSTPKPSFSPEYIPQPPNIEKIFSNNHDWIATLSASKKITLIATGDVIPARTVNYQATISNNFKWPFENTALLLKSADITLINLESPLIKNCPLTQTGMIFCGNEKNIEGLTFAGVDVANLANNHSGNHGKEGLDYTKSLLKNNNIEYSSEESLAIKQVSDIKFGFLGYNALNPINKETVSSEIQKAKEKVDILVVSYHWGAEYQRLPSNSTVDLAHFSIDNGADLIIGNHPHWIQPIEIYKDKLITYAHGNFVFDQMWSEETKKGVIGIYTFYGGNLVDSQFIPIYIKDYGQPFFPNSAESKNILDGMRSASEKLSTDH